MVVTTIVLCILTCCL